MATKPPVEPISPYALIADYEGRHHKLIEEGIAWVNDCLLPSRHFVVTEGQTMIYHDGRFPAWKWLHGEIVERFRKAGWIVESAVFDSPPAYYFKLPGKIIGNGHSE